MTWFACGGWPHDGSVECCELVLRRCILVPSSSGLLVDSVVILAVKAWCVCGAVACGQMLPFGDLWSICVAMQVGVCGGWPCLRRMAGDLGRQSLACSADC